MKLVLFIGDTTIPAPLFAQVAERVGGKLTSEPITHIHLYGCGNYDDDFTANLKEWFPGAARIHHRFIVGSYSSNVGQWRRVIARVRRNIRGAEHLLAIVCAQYPEQLWYVLCDNADVAVNFEHITPADL